MKRAALVLAVLAGACGDDEAGPELGEISVIVQAPAVALERRRLIFHDANGEVVELIAPSSDTVTGRITRGGMVTFLAAETPESNGIRHTVANLEPGDQLTLVWHPPSFDTALLGTAQVSLPGAFPGAIEYRVESSCRFITTTNVRLPIELPNFEGCHAGETIDVLAIAENNIGARLAYTLALDQPLDGPITLPAWKTDFTVHSVQITNLGEKVASVSQGLIGERDIWSSSQRAGGTSGAFIFAHPPGFGAGLGAYLFIFDDPTRQDSPFTSMLFADPSKSATVAFDARTEFAPILSPQANTEDPSRPHLTWSTAELEDSMEGVRIFGGGWLVQADAQTGSFRFPAMPELGDFKTSLARPEQRYFYLEDDDRQDSWTTVRADGKFPTGDGWPRLNARVTGRRVRQSFTTY